MADETLSTEELKTIIGIVWEALQAPRWNKDDLIDLGKTIYAKTPLKNMDEKLFIRLFPHIATIARSVGTKIKAMSKQETPESERSKEEQTKEEETNG
jgi:hypothetical protein